MTPRNDNPDMLNELQRYFDSLGEQYGFEPAFSEENRDGILGLTGVAAHTVVRPAAPAAALAVGYLVGSGQVNTWQEAIDAVKRHTRAYVGDPAPEPQAKQ